MYNFTTSAWLGLGGGPNPRHSHTSWWFGSKLILFGGIDQKEGYIDVWMFDPFSRKWEVLGSKCTIYCPTVFEASTVFVPVSKSEFSIYVFGGVHWNNGISSFKLYHFNSTTTTWSYISNGPISHQGGTGVYHQKSNSLRFLGGCKYYAS